MGIFRRSLVAFTDLVRIVLPVMVLVRIGEEFGLSQSLGVLLGPVMDIAGLPAETGVVWAIALLTGLYGGIGAYITLLPELSMTFAQHSILCAMMLFAHAIPVEQAIVRRAGAGFAVTSILRIGAALTYGAIVYWICARTGALSAPLDLSWLAGADASQGWISWTTATLKTLVSILGIIIGLHFMLDVLDRIGATQWMTNTLEPVLRVIGIDTRLAPMTMIGMLLGLTFGGGLIIQSTKETRYTPKARFLALSCLCLLHSVIEDTILMIAIGADIWVVLVGRAAFSLAIVAVMAWTLNHLPESVPQ